MENNNKLVKMSDKDYARYLENVEEMEGLILAAEKSCRQIEQIRKQQLRKNGRTKRMQLTKLKKFTKILVK